VFQDEFAKAFAVADQVLIAPVFRNLADAERLSVPQLIRALNGQGQSDSIDDIVDVIVREHKAGDLIVLMSNGEFGGIHQRLLRALEGGEVPAPGVRKGRTG
jgi:UDP-N-acetylmuramate: L-alanyl-gamma-D-glutamyl-meso-diaminopimelate ligase